MEQTVKSLDVTCPECRGPVQEVSRPGLVEYRCLVGHTFSARTLLAYHHDAEERCLWAAVVALEETEQMVKIASADFPPEIRERMAAQVEKKLEQASRIRRILEELEAFDLD